ncbi:MAG: hypothetical protein Q8L37_05735 [Candidatus Gottesmanbacteria bacterium]|nr:hypothetical protein [Candidatus Gottesmanbacteria bacterium]
MTDVCGSGPWKNTDAEVIHAALWLANSGVNIAGLSDGEVLLTYQSVRYPILPDVYSVDEQSISIRVAGERK